MPLRSRMIASLTQVIAERVDFRGADEVVLVQPADRVRLVSGCGNTPAEFDVGMVILDVGDVRDRIHETRGCGRSRRT